MYFLPWREVWNGPSKRINLYYFINSISKLCSICYLFKIKCPKPELNIWVGNFYTHVPPPGKVCVWGGGWYWRP